MVMQLEVNKIYKLSSIAEWRTNKSLIEWQMITTELSKVSAQTHQSETASKKICRDTEKDHIQSNPTLWTPRLGGHLT